jgi:hypothetical protein
MQLLAIFLLIFTIFVIFVVLTNKELFQTTQIPIVQMPASNNLEYLQDINVEGNVKCEGDVTINKKLTIDSLTIDDVTLSKDKLNELTQLPLVNLTSICLRDSPTDTNPICFSKEDIEFFKMFRATEPGNNEVYVRWNV